MAVRPVLPRQVSGCARVWLWKGCEQMGVFSRLRRRSLTRVERLNRAMSGGGEVRFVEESPPVDAPLPEEWRALPALSPAERVGVMADRMDHYVGDVLPETVAFIRRCGRDAELALWGERYIVVYTLVNSTGTTLDYYGGNPFQPTWPGEGEPRRIGPSHQWASYDFNVHAVWDRVPAKLRSFYENVHDGLSWCNWMPDSFYELRAVNEFSSGVFPDFDMLDNDALCERAKGCYVFFEHTSGSLLTLDVVGESPGRADYWSSGGAFEFGIDLWQALDEFYTGPMDPEYYAALEDAR